MFVCLLAFQPWRRRLARRRPRTGRQRGGGGRHEVGRRRFDLHPAGSRGGIDRRLPVHPEYPVRSVALKGGVRWLILRYYVPALREFAGHSYMVSGGAVRRWVAGSAAL